MDDSERAHQEQGRARSPSALTSPRDHWPRDQVWLVRLRHHGQGRDQGIRLGKGTSRQEHGIVITSSKEYSTTTPLRRESWSESTSARNADKLSHSLSWVAYITSISKPYEIFAS